MLYLFFVPLACDVASTWGVYIAQGHLNTEANPIFVLTNSMLITFGTLVVVCILYYLMIVKWSLRFPTTRWLILSAILWTIPLRAYAVIGNLRHIAAPVAYEVTVNNPTYAAASKIGYYNAIVGLLVFLPLIIQMVTFWIYKLDYEVVRKEPLTQSSESKGVKG